MAIGRTLQNTLNGRYFALEIAPGAALLFNGEAQCIERISAHGAAGAVLTLTIPGAGGAVNFTLGAGQSIHVFEILGRYDLKQNFTVACGAGCTAVVEFVDLT
jgi:hypothetical protein